MDIPGCDRRLQRRSEVFTAETTTIVKKCAAQEMFSANIHELFRD